MASKQHKLAQQRHQCSRIVLKVMLFIFFWWFKYTNDSVPANDFVIKKYSDYQPQYKPSQISK